MSNLPHPDPALQSARFELVTDSNECTDIDQKIERAFWEFQRAKAHLQDLLLLRQCLAWEAARAFDDLDPYPLH